MKLLHVAKDGGPESTVTGYWLIELKDLFSIALLRFDDGTRAAFHSHAFDCVSWVLSGRLSEEHLDGGGQEHKPSIRPVVTRRDTFHRVRSTGTSWVLTFRGPWAGVWFEFDPTTRKATALSHGRIPVQA